LAIHDVNVGFSERTLKPASQKGRIATRELLMSPGRMWACRHSIGSVGMSRMTVCVGRMMEASGSCMGIPVLVARLLVQGLSIRKK
jgi:hypothetical protein